VEKRPLISAMILSLTASCASPLVKYNPVIGPDESGLTKFQLAESMISFAYGKTSAGLPTKEINITSVPIPYSDKKYGMSGTGFWENAGVVTTINAAFRGDSPLIQQVTVAVTDERQQALQTLGSIAGAAGGLLTTSDELTSLKLPKGISVTKFLASIPSGCTGSRDEEIKCRDLQLDGTTDFAADVAVSKKPIDALPASILDKPLASPNFFYSACRQMTITLTPKSSSVRDPISATVAVADPMYVETLRFPEKGNITVAPSCGANSVAQDANLPNAIAYLNTLVTQAKAVKQALDSSNSSGAKSKTTATTTTGR
jgi:hypothetical protein